MSRQGLARQAGEVGELRQRNVHAEGAGATAPVTDALLEAARQYARIDELQIEQLRVEVRDHGGGPERLTLLRDRANGPAVLDDHLAHRAVEPDLDAPGDRGLRHRLRNGTHSADC